MSMDIAKGIGLFVVILGHLTTYGNTLFDLIFGFHMPLFFFIAGYFTPRNFDGRKLSKRLRNLSLSYLEFVLIGTIVTLLVPVWRNQLTITRFLYDVVYNVQPECVYVGQVWFLASLGVSLTLFFVISKIFSKDVFIIAAGFLCFFVAYSITNYNIQIVIWGYNLRFPFKTDTSCAAVLFLIIGNMAKKYDVVSKIKSKWTISMLIWFAGLFFYIVLVLINGTVNICVPTFGNPFLYVCHSVLGIYLVICVSIVIQKLKTLSKVLAYYGRNSLSIFAMHSFWLYLYAFVLGLMFDKKVEIMSNLSMSEAVIGAIIIFALSAPVTYLYNHTLGKINASLGKGEKQWKSN